MNTYNNQAQQKYKETGIQTASQGQLIIKLYRGAIKFLNLAEKFIEEEDIEQANNHLIRVQQIINELRYSLDHEKGGEVSANLEALYDFMYRTLVDANMDKDVEKIDQVREIMKELLEAWEEANKEVNKKQNQAQNRASKVSVDGKE